MGRVFDKQRGVSTWLDRTEASHDQFIIVPIALKGMDKMPSWQLGNVITHHITFHSRIASFIFLQDVSASIDCSRTLASTSPPHLTSDLSFCSLAQCVFSGSHMCHFSLPFSDQLLDPLQVELDSKYSMLF